MVRFVGAAEDVARAADEVGYSLVPSKLVDYVYLDFGVLAGILIGMITVSVAGVPVALGTGGGCLIFGWLRAKHSIFGNLPGSTAQYLRDFGLAVFIASVGSSTGPQAIAQIKQFGLTLPIVGFFAVLLPCLLMVFYGRLVLNRKNELITGILHETICKWNSRLS